MTKDDYRIVNREYADGHREWALQKNVWRDGCFPGSSWEDDQMFTCEYDAKVALREIFSKLVVSERVIDPE